MAIIIVPKRLRDAIGDAASEALVDMLNEQEHNTVNELFACKYPPAYNKAGFMPRYISYDSSRVFNSSRKTAAALPFINRWSTERSTVTT